MSKDFKEKLELYKEGKLSIDEAEKIENEIDRYAAIREYLEEDDKIFMSKLKEELDVKAPAVNSVGKKINKRIISKLVKVSLITILACVFIIPMLSLSVLSILGNTFRIDSDRFSQEQYFAGQFLHMAFPEVSSGGGGNHTEFYKQAFYFDAITGIGRRPEIREVEVRYSFGKLIKPQNGDNRFNYYSSELFHALNPETYFTASEWDYLVKAPTGTKAQIFVTFRSKLTPRQAKAALGEEVYKQNEDIRVNMLAYTGAPVVLANANPDSFYSRNNNASKNNTTPSKENELNFTKSFNSYDNDIHKDVMLFGLNEIKKYKNIAKYISYYYSYNQELTFDDIDEMISTVEKDGVQYVGAVISGDTKELLKLKNNSNIFACRVDDIIVW